MATLLRSIEPPIPITKEQHEVLFHEYSNAEVSQIIHAQDISFIDINYGKTCRNLSHQHKILDGISYNPPWIALNRTCALVYYNLLTEQEEWVHIDKKQIELWKEYKEY